MERKEFSELLVKVRTEAGMSRYTLGLQMQVSDLVLQRIELSMNNYGMNKVFLYLEYFDKSVVISNGRKTVIINSEEQFSKWLSPLINKIGKAKFSELCGIHYNTISNVEKGKTTARIDTFLKIIETLGYHIEKIE